MFFILAIIEFFANIVSWVGFGWVSEKSIYNVRVLVFRSLFEQDLAWHQSDDRSPTGSLGYITNDGNLIAGLSGSVIGTIFSICINLVVAVMMSLIIAWKIALVCIAVVPLLLGTGVMQLRVLGQFEERHENAFNQSVNISVEAINSIKTIASLSLEEETLAAFRRTLHGLRRETTAISLHANLWLGLAYFLGNLSYALAFWWGSKQIFNGTYSETEFIIVMFALLVSAQLWSQMFVLAPEVSNTRAAVARVLSILEIGSSGAKYQPHALPEPSTEKDVEASAKTQSFAPRNTGRSRCRIPKRQILLPSTRTCSRPTRSQRARPTRPVLCTSRAIRR
jgi:ABC-type bacteriocin/lantibiotic exporter with double-glycine peptidase domain